MDQKVLPNKSFSIKSTLLQLIIIGIAVALSACGGGDGRDDFNAQTGLTVSSGTDAVTLTWQQDEAAGSYNIYRSQVPDGVTNDLCADITSVDYGNPIAVTTATTYQDVPSPALTAFCYAVQPCRDATGRFCGEIGEARPGALRVETLTPLSAAIKDDGRFIYAGQTATLHAFVNNPDIAAGTVVYDWRQIAGVKVSNLTGETTETLRFTAPDTPGLIAFGLSVSDDNGLGDPAKVALTVVPMGGVVVQMDAPNRVVKPGDTVSMHAVVSTASGSEPSIEWTQLSPTTPVIPLTGATTANPTFTAPDLPGQTLRFQVKATDPANGDFSLGTVPITITQPAPTVASNQALSVQAPVPQVPIQLLSVVAGPELVAIGGSDVTLAVSTTGGSAPYSWQWSQPAGQGANFLSGTTVATPKVRLPSVPTAQNLTFTAEITDADGTMRSAQVLVYVLPTSPPEPTVLIPPIIRAPVAMVAQKTIDISVYLSNVLVAQVSGPQLTISQASLSGGAATKVTVTAPNIQQHSASATLGFTGTNSRGETITQLQQLEIIRPPSIAPPLSPPPIIQVPPTNQPALYDPLIILTPSLLRASEGQSGVTLLVSAKGGIGSYTYNWVQTGPIDSATGQLDPALEVTLDDAALRTPSLDLSAVDVDKNTPLTFEVTVTSGNQTRTKTVILEVDNVVTGPAPLNVGTLNDLIAVSGHEVYLHAPTPKGGIPPYTYTVQQLSGPTVSVDQPFAGNYTFIAPAMSPGDPDLTLEFEYAIEDGAGNQVKMDQSVIVKAPGYGALVAQFSAPPALDINNLFADQLVAVGHAVGGTGTYTWTWTMTPDFAGATPVVKTVQAPSFTLPVPPVGLESYTVELTMEVTDSAPTTFTETTTVLVNSANTDLVRTVIKSDGSLTPGDFSYLPRDSVKNPYARPGAECVVCGDYNQNLECSDLDLVLSITTKCPDTDPYCINEVRVDVDPNNPNNVEVKQFSRCVSGSLANGLWYELTRTRQECKPGPNVERTPGVTCHFACWEDENVGICNSVGTITRGGNDYDLLNDDAGAFPPATVYGVDSQGYVTPRVD